MKDMKWEGDYAMQSLNKAFDGIYLCVELKFFRNFVLLFIAKARHS